MKAVVFEKLGGPEVLHLGEVPKPQAAPGTVVIRVRAAGINFADTLFRQGQCLMQPELPDVPGFEAAGEIDSVGSACRTSSPVRASPESAAGPMPNMPSFPQARSSRSPNPSCGPEQT